MTDGAHPRLEGDITESLAARFRLIAKARGKTATHLMGICMGLARLVDERDSALFPYEIHMGEKPLSDELTDGSTEPLVEHVGVNLSHDHKTILEVIKARRGWDDQTALIWVLQTTLPILEAWLDGARVEARGDKRRAKISPA